MSTPGDDAQRNLEQKALRNVRALVDKIESTEELEGRALRRQVTVIVCVVLVIAAAAFVAYKVTVPEHAPQTVVIPPPQPSK